MIYIYSKEEKLYGKVFSSKDITEYGFVPVDSTADVPIPENKYHDVVINADLIDKRYIKLGIWEFGGDYEVIRMWFDSKEDYIAPDIKLLSLKKCIHLTEGASRFLAQKSTELKSVPEFERLQMESLFNMYSGDFMKNKQLMERFTEIYDRERAKARAKKLEEYYAAFCEKLVPCWICGSRETCKASNKDNPDAYKWSAHGIIL